MKIHSHKQIFTPDSTKQKISIIKRLCNSTSSNIQFSNLPSLQHNINHNKCSTGIRMSLDSNIANGFFINNKKKYYNLKVEAFDNWANCYSESSSDEETLNKIKQLRSIDFFSLILQRHNDEILTENAYIDDDFTFQFFQKLANNEYIKGLVHKIIKQHGEIIISKKNFDKHRLRALVILLYMPQLYNSFNSGLLSQLMNLIGGFSNFTKSILAKWLSHLPKLVGLLIQACHMAIGKTLSQIHQQPFGYTQSINLIINTIAILYESNKMLPQPYPSEDFINKELDERATYRHCPAFPYVLSFQTRLKVIRAQVKELQTAAEVDNMVNSTDGRLEIIVNRKLFFEQTKKQLLKLHSFEFYRRAKVTFLGEVAVDAGGPKRELFRMMTNYISDHALQLINNDQFFWFKHADLSYFSLLGLILGMAIGNEITLSIRFPSFLYKKIYQPNYKPTFQDLEEFDPVTAKSLQQIREMGLNNEDISSLELTFDVNIDNNTIVPVNEAKSGVPVTNDNYEEFCQDYIDWAINKNFSQEFHAFRNSFLVSCPRYYIKFLSPLEIDKVISGETNYDWDELKKAALYKDGLTIKSERIVWFWEVFGEMDEETKLLFLRFTTGIDRAPFGGLGTIKIKFHDGGNDDKLPTSHTCFNMFFLPNYKSKKQLKAKVYLSLNYAEGFGLI